jgi:hypothetical protein
MNAPPRCPPNRALGCAAGALVSPKRKMAEPPKDANKNGEAGGATSDKAMNTPADMPNKHQRRRSAPDLAVSLTLDDLDAEVVDVVTGVGSYAEVSVGVTLSRFRAVQECGLTPKLTGAGGRKAAGYQHWPSKSRSDGQCWRPC